MTKRIRFIQRDGGAVSIEIIGVIALLVLVGVLAVQGIFAAQLGSVTESAARDGARAVSTASASAESTVQNALPGWATLTAVKTGTAAKPGCAGTCVLVEAEYAIGLIGIERLITVERVAELPEI